MAEKQNQMTPAQYVGQVAEVAQNQIEKFVSQQRLNLPQNFSAGNAIKQLQLKIQDDSKLLACSQASLLKVMIDSAVLGLNISKSQMYVIPYGNTAQISVSYLGKVAIAKRIDPTIADIVGKAVRKGETFEFEDYEDGYSHITKHSRTLESMNSKDFLAGYATIIYNDGKPSKSLILTYDRIKESWSMSTAKPIDNNGNVKTGSVHDKFADDMIVKTCISAICKGIIAKSDDKDLFAETLQRVELEEVATMSSIEAEEKNGVGDFVDVDFEEVENEQNSTSDVSFKVDEETGEVVL